MIILLASKQTATPVNQTNESIYQIFPNKRNDSSYRLYTVVQQTHTSEYSITTNKENSSEYWVWQHTTKTNTSSFSILVESVNDSGYDITGFFYSKYILNVGQQTESAYQVLVSQKSDTSYSILTGTGNGSAYEIVVGQSSTSEFSNLTGQSNQAPYSVQVKQENVGVYTIPLRIRHEGAYVIWQVFHPKQTHESSYRITDYTYVSQYNESKYEISLTGVTAISERYFGLEDPYYLYSSDRQIHPHLYNTYQSDRNATYEFYTTNPNERTCVVVREIIGDDRNALFEVYTIEVSERNNETVSYSRHDDSRSAHLSSYALVTSDRTIIASQIAHLNTARNCVYLSIYNDFRYAYAKSWHVSERISILHAKERDRIGDQRYCVAQVSITHGDVIRTAYFESYSIRFDFVINPHYNQIDIGAVNSTFVPLFENETVTEFVNEFNQVPINWHAPGVDLIIIDHHATWWRNLADEALVAVPTATESANTEAFKGYLIHRHKPLFTKLEVYFKDASDFPSPDEKYQYLVRHGYLKMVIDHQEMSDREAIVECAKARTPIPIEFYIYDQMMDDLWIEITWAYPYKTLMVHKAFLEFVSD